jgi:APA family basic amino acid/polyamine antiporter
VLFAVARDHEVMRPLRRIDPRFGTPALAIVAESAWAAVLVLGADVPTWLGLGGTSTGTEPKRLFDILTDYMIFGASVFYLISVLAVFVLRSTRPDVPRPYRTWGYPWVPAIFAVAYVFLLVSMAWAAPLECFSGLGLIAVGVIVYALFLARRPAVTHGG